MTRAHLAWCQKCYSASERKAFLDRLTDEQRLRIKESIEKSAREMNFSSQAWFFPYSIQSLLEVALDRMIDDIQKERVKQCQFDAAFQSLGLV